MGMALKLKVQASPTRSPSRRSSACSGLSCGSWVCGSWLSAGTAAKHSITTHQRITASCCRGLLFPSTRSALLFRTASIPHLSLSRFVRYGRNLDDVLTLSRPSDALCRRIVVRSMNRFRDRADVARRLAFGLNGMAKDAAVVSRRQILLRFPQMLHLRQQQRRHSPVRISHALGARYIDGVHLATPL